MLAWTTKCAISVLMAVPLLVAVPAGREQKKEEHAAGKIPPVLWRDPGVVATRNLLYGPGGSENAPRGKYSFVKEAMSGSGAKFEVTDERGVTWTVKLGGEVQSETAATRLLWSVGYFTNEDYYLPEIRVEGMRALSRGQEFVSAGGVIHGVRLKRHLDTEKESGNWSWFKNPFLGSREFDGLKVVMALIGNWDLKDYNNKIYTQPDGEPRYMVGDLGESFGDPAGETRGDLRGFSRVEFLYEVGAQDVSFYLPNRPPWYVLIFEYRKYQGRRTMEQIVQHIPRAHVKWIGNMLGQLSPEQVRDCFRAAGYSPAEVDGFARVVLERIARLKKL
jgi:hypothetical protein